MPPDDGQLPGKEHEDAANLTNLCRQEIVDDFETQAKALADSKAKDEDRAKAVGDFQAKAEARERGQTQFGPKPKVDDPTKKHDASDELDDDEPDKKTPPAKPARPAPTPPPAPAK